MTSSKIPIVKSLSTDKSKEVVIPMEPKEAADVQEKAHYFSSTSFSAAAPPSEMIQYQGHWNFPSMVESIKSAQEHFMAQEGDVILSSFPKTGTTWLKSLAFAIMSRRQYKENSPLLTTFPHHCVPYIEHSFGDRPFWDLLGGKHRLASTHIPYGSLPSSVVTALKSGVCKIVYIWREPKDTMVSFWHFLSKNHRDAVPFNAMFEHFCEGKVVAGPYWNHIIGYWEASKEYPNNILFLKYEDMLRNTKDNVKRLAEFVGCPFSVQEEEEGEVEKIIELCSFKRLSNLEVNKVGSCEGFVPGTTRKMNTFFRKGEVGDWKEYLTPKMKEKLDLIFEEKFKDQGFSFEGS